MWKNDIRAPSVPTLRPLPTRTALLSSSMTNCVTTAMAKLRSGKMTRGMANFESTVVRSETGSDFQNRMLRSRRSPYSGDCQTPRKSYKTHQTVGWLVGWDFLGKIALNATLHGSDVSSERDSTRHGCHASRVRSSTVRTLVRDCGDNPAASSTIVKQSRKEN